MKKINEKKKCLSLLEELKLAPQFKFEVFLISYFFVFFLLIVLSLEIYLLNFIKFKEIYNQIDTLEFDELNYIELKIENLEIQLQNAYKNTLVDIVNFYKEINYDITYLTLQVNSNKINFNATNSLNIDDLNSDPNNFAKNIKYDCVSDCTINQNEYSLLGVYLKNILYNKKIFLNKEEEIDKYDKTIFLFFIFDYSNNAIFYYPPYIDEVQQPLTQQTMSDMKSYSINKAQEKIEEIKSFENIKNDNYKKYDNIFDIPFFDEDLYNNNTNYTFPDIFNNTNGTNYEVKFVSFMFLPKNDSEPIDLYNFTETVDKIFALISINSIKSLIYDNIIKSNIGISLLKTNYYYPYLVSYKEYCYNIRLLTLSSCNESEILDENYQYLMNNYDSLPIYLIDCFNDNSTIYEYQKYKEYKDLTIYNNFVNNFNLVSQSTIFGTNTEIINEQEKKIITNFNTSFNNFYIDKILQINEQKYKIHKAIKPLSYYFLTNLSYYPLYNIKANYIFKSEGYNTYVVNEFLSSLLGILFTGIIIVAIINIILFFILYIIMHIFVKQLDKPVQKLNDTAFITGQTTSNIDDEKKNLISAQDLNEEETKIDEFRNLIHLINDMVKGDLKLKQSCTQKEENYNKLEIEKFNKEFEKTKIFNIIVKQNEIENIIEESNFSSEITKQNLNDIQKDSFIKKSLIYKNILNNKQAYEKNIINSKSDNSIDFELSCLQSKKNLNEYLTNNKSFKICKNENSLQNPNTFLYLEFKKKFDKNYYVKYKEKLLEKNKNKKNPNYNIISSKNSVYSKHVNNVINPLNQNYYRKNTISIKEDYIDTSKK